MAAAECQAEGKGVGGAEPNKMILGRDEATSVSGKPRTLELLYM